LDNVVLNGTANHGLTVDQCNQKFWQCNPHAAKIFGSGESVHTDQ